jgi:predicted enzyme related to lactoylglutathione lyase
MLRGKPVAGVMPLTSPDQPVAWSTHVAVDDADATFERVTSNGGQPLAEPMDVMDLGRMTFFLDPAGAAIGAWQANQFHGAAIVNEAGSLNWNELHTRDLEAAQAFYSAVFGWTIDERDFDGMTYTIWQVDDHGVGGGMQMGDQSPPDEAPNWAVYFSVDDADASANTATELGATVTMGPIDIPNVGRFAGLTDPQGASFSIIKATPPEG